MKFAFSTVGCPQWDFPKIVARAQEYGFAGVEIRGYLNESPKTLADVFKADAAQLRAQFAEAKVEIAALSSAIAMTGNRRKDKMLEADVRRYIDLAQALGASLVKILDRQVPSGQSRESGAVELASWLTPIGDYAAERGVCVVVENALSFRRAREMWTVLETANHPAVAVCWDVFNAAVVGESPFVSVPGLNSRIAYVKVKDGKFGPSGGQLARLGEGTVPVNSFLTRLRGIGYSGFVTFEWDKASLPELAEPEVVFVEALAKLKQWTAVEVKTSKKASSRSVA